MPYVQSESQGGKSTQEYLEREPQIPLWSKSSEESDRRCLWRQTRAIMPNERAGGLPDALRLHKQDWYVTDMAVLVDKLLKYFVFVDKEPFTQNHSLSPN